MGAFRKFMSAVTAGAVAPYSTAEKQLIRMNARVAGATDRELRYAGTRYAGRIPAYMAGRAGQAQRRQAAREVMLAPAEPVQVPDEIGTAEDRVVQAALRRLSLESRDPQCPAPRKAAIKAEQARLYKQLTPAFRDWLSQASGEERARRLAAAQQVMRGPRT